MILRMCNLQTRNHLQGMSRAKLMVSRIKFSFKGNPRASLDLEEIEIEKKYGKKLKKNVRYQFSQVKFLSLNYELC